MKTIAIALACAFLAVAAFASPVPQEVSASNNNDDSKSDLEGAETFYVNKI
jgi:hypothetical protein